MHNISTGDVDAMHRIQKYDSVCLEEFRKFFEGLPLDAYSEEKCRYRRYSRFHVMSGNLNQLSHRCFEQAAEYNPLLGGIKRDYLELERELAGNDSFRRLVLDFVKICEIDRNETEVGVH